MITIRPQSACVRALALGCAVLLFAHADYTPVLAMAQSGYHSDSEIEHLVAPIALYPDPLIAQILPASTYPDEVADAADYVAKHGPTDRNIDRQGWDNSVAAVARYPVVLEKMADDMDWTADLGDAFLAQPIDVMDAIQTCRGVARQRGILRTTQHQAVVYEEQNIRIVPALDSVIYVPSYEPRFVYVDYDKHDHSVDWGAIAASAISFGAGLAIGSWLHSDCDWHGRGLYYPRWGNRPSWVHYREGGHRDVDGVVIINRPVNNYYNYTRWNHDSRRYSSNVSRYGDRYNSRYRDLNRARNRQAIRNERIARSGEYARVRNRDRNVNRYSDGYYARERAESRDLTRPATRAERRRDVDPDRTARATRDVNRTRDRAVTSPAPERPRRDAFDRQPLERDRQQRQQVSRGHIADEARKPEARRRQRDATAVRGYERGSTARQESDRGLRSRKQADPRASGAFVEGGSRDRSRVKAKEGRSGGAGSGARGAGGKRRG